LIINKSTFAFVPGAWNSPSCYDSTISCLSSSSYRPSVNIPLPSIETNPQTHGFTEDVNHLRQMVTELVNQNKDVILVTHSYSGLPGAKAVHNLFKPFRFS
ncbi:hypothetical protein GQ43DRAFT_377460, partial [Delitschia confertaspora ATCC 74209]